MTSKPLTTGTRALLGSGVTLLCLLFGSALPAPLGAVVSFAAFVVFVIFVAVFIRILRRHFKGSLRFFFRCFIAGMRISD